jgi:hypothetical protein
MSEQTEIQGNYKLRKCVVRYFDSCLFKLLLPF